MFRQHRSWVRIGSTLGLAVLIASPVIGQEGFKESYTARVVSMTTTNPPIIPMGMTTTMQITVTRWSTDEERNQLLATLVEKGQEEFIKALQKQEETGFVRVTGAGAYLGNFPSQRLRYAREVKEGNRRRLVLALDRPIPYFEAIQRGRTYDYNFSLIVFELDEEGKGEGSLALAVKLGVDQEKKQLIIENYGTEPLRLTSVTMNK